MLLAEQLCEFCDDMHLLSRPFPRLQVVTPSQGQAGISVYVPLLSALPGGAVKKHDVLPDLRRIAEVEDESSRQATL